MEVPRGSQENFQDVVPIENMDYIFHYNQGYARTNLTTLFFTSTNLEYLRQEISDTVGRMLGEPGVHAVLTVDFYNYVADLLSTARNTSDVYQGLSQVNLTVLNHEIPIHYHSLRRRQLFIKWAILKDRPTYIEHPQNSNGRRLATPLTTGVYGLHDPRGRHHADALAFMGLGQ